MRDGATMMVSALVVAGAVTTWVFLVLRLVMYYRSTPRDAYRQIVEQIATDQRQYQAKLDELMVRTTAIQRLLEDAD
jgi:hypothetical protein